MADPASLNVAVSISGLTPNEAMAVFAILPAGATGAFQVTQPALGGKRYAISTEALSVQGARDVTTALYAHCEQVWNSGEQEADRAD